MTKGWRWRYCQHPGTAQVNADRQALRDVIFDRTMESLYNTGDVDQYRMCEWGVMKRTVEAIPCGQRPAKIVALGAAMSKMAIITAPNSRIYEPEQLKDTPVAVSPFNGSHFTTLKMLEGFVKKEHILVVNAGTMHERLEAVRRGDVAAGNFMEPWISIAQKQGFRILMESHSTRSEAASDDLDGPTLAAMFRAEAKAAELINSQPCQVRALSARRKPRACSRRTSCRPGACSMARPCPTRGNGLWRPTSGC